MTSSQEWSPPTLIWGDPLSWRLRFHALQRRRLEARHVALVPGAPASVAASRAGARQTAAEGQEPPLLASLDMTPWGLRWACTRGQHLACDPSSEPCRQHPGGLVVSTSLGLGHAPQWRHPSPAWAACRWPRDSRGPPTEPLTVGPTQDSPEG